MASHPNMKTMLPYALYQRELQSSAPRSPRVRSIYGNKDWIRDLDIVNELEGHSGCVNALSWSKNGRLLASGSDDQHLNIHTYQPSDSHSQFSLSTTVATGHTQNIFSVKFMPHSNDRTLITAAGDSEVRVFDIEYAGTQRAASRASELATHGRRRGRNNLYNGVRYLSDGDTNCRVYRSHGDRAKRIVTESSPHLFLTCSEDGEVRQWDLRQPSSAYPAPRGGRSSTFIDDSVPPALISYKRYMLDLNTISCSANQPHYIALGGAHLHCFLHDRRMLGRDILKERGILPGTAMSDADEELMGQATQCVKKFAPNGKQRMRKTDNGHITACKISDANPNEMIVSWSGEHIYSFDLLRTPDANDIGSKVREPLQTSSGHRVREGQDRNRKRKNRGGSMTPLSDQGAIRAESRQRTESQSDDGDIALRVQYENGQTEDIPLEAPSDSGDLVTNARQSAMSSRQKNADNLAKRSVKLRQSMFSLDNPKRETEIDPTGYGHAFTSVLGFCASTLPQMREIHAAWRYPVEPDDVELYLQRKLRENRETTMRFIQAAGVIARTLGGQLKVASGTHPAFELFQRVDPMLNEGPDIQEHEQFGYDFLKAIVLWLESGVGALIEGFTWSPNASKKKSRNTVPQDSGVEAIDEYIIPYLLELASDRTIYNVDASRFEVDENRILFRSERDAVLSFAAALKVPFADLSSALADPEQSHSSVAMPDDDLTQDRRRALKKWGLTTARGVLMNAAEGVNYAFVGRAFGGLGQADTHTARQEARYEQRHEDIDATPEELAVRSAEVIHSRNQETERTSPSLGEELVPMSDVSAILQHFVSEEDMADDVLDEFGSEDVEMEQNVEDDEIDNSIGDEDDDDDDEADNDEDEDEDDDNDNDDSDDDVDDDDDEAEEAGFGLPRQMYQSATNRRLLRETVEEDIPCAPHTRVYRGHCNVKTVKDVNFFGLDDDYVVSGSDDGNVFIWDRKTAQLVNILEGDGEVVNVLQGHPYEPMLAVSGIDHTIKVFSPDARAREYARLGRGVAAADASEFSSIAWPARMGGRRIPRRGSSNVQSEPAVPATPEVEEDEYVAPNGLASRKRFHDEYRITSQNDVDRQGGNQEAFITRSMLAQLAASIRRQRAEGGPQQGQEAAFGLGGRIVINDDCIIM